MPKLKCGDRASDVWRKGRQQSRLDWIGTHSFELLANISPISATCKINENSPTVNFATEEKLWACYLVTDVGGKESVLLTRVLTTPVQRDKCVSVWRILWRSWSRRYHHAQLTAHYACGRLRRCRICVFRQNRKRCYYVVNRYSPVYMINRAACRLRLFIRRLLCQMS